MGGPTSVRMLLAVSLFYCLVGHCDELRAIGEQSSVTSTDSLRERGSNEIEKFMVCRVPFHPTARLRLLIEKRIIPAKPLVNLDGVPYFTPSTESKFFGQTVLLVGAFDRTDWSEFYKHSPGTTAPTQTVVYVIGDKKSVQAYIPPTERKWLLFDEDPNFWAWAPSLRKTSAVQDRVTAVVCSDDEARARGTRR